MFNYNKDSTRAELELKISEMAAAHSLEDPKLNYQKMRKLCLK
jgi:hypothetical protein